MRPCWPQWSMKDEKLSLSKLKNDKREIEEIKKKKQELYQLIYLFMHWNYRSSKRADNTQRTWNSASKHQLVFINKEILNQKSCKFQISNPKFFFNILIEWTDEIPCFYFVRKGSESTVTVVAFRTSSVFEITYSSFDQIVIRCLRALEISRKRKEEEEEEIHVNVSPHFCLRDILRMIPGWGYRENWAVARN